MAYIPLRSSRFPGQDRRRRRNRAMLAVSVAALALAGSQVPDWRHTPPSPAVSVAAMPEATPVRHAPVDYAWMFDPSPALGSAASDPGLSAPLTSDFQIAAAVPDEAAEPPALPVAEVEAPRPIPRAHLALSVPLPIPLPVPRPPEFRREPVTVTARLVRRPAMPSTQSVFRAARIEEPSLFERIFGDAPATTALGYAAVDGRSQELSARQRLVPAPVPMGAAGTAVYDITAQRVTLPNGEVLEAHSGLGVHMDNPRGVHLSMRGATPPGTYELREREALFHGVRAIRLNPVGGPAAINGRVGLLAHTYMLGPSGASNGCVSFRDYNRFLQAYLRGEVQRLVVVAGTGQDGPSWGGRVYGQSGRSANRG